MAITATTLAGAVAPGDLVLNVASATGSALKNTIRIDNEFFVQTALANGTLIPVRGGDQGSARVAHNAGTAVLMGLPTDFLSPPIGTDIPVPYSPVETTLTYNAAGAIAIPTTIRKAFIELVTGTAGAFTLADPTSAQEGVELTILAKDAEAYTVTNGSPNAGFNGGGSGSDVATYNGTIGSSLQVRAINKVWNVLRLTGVTLG
jgi:hypothetical protein